MMTSTTTGVRTYQIDKAHSEAIFQVRHLLTKVSGRFEDFSGAAYSSHRDHFVQAIVITRSSDRDRSEATLGTSVL